MYFIRMWDFTSLIMSIFLVYPRFQNNKSEARKTSLHLPTTKADCALPPITFLIRMLVMSNKVDEGKDGKLTAKLMRFLCQTSDLPNIYVYLTVP